MIRIYGVRADAVRYVQTSTSLDSHVRCLTIKRILCGGPPKSRQCRKKIAENHLVLPLSRMQSEVDHTATHRSTAGLASSPRSRLASSAWEGDSLMSLPLLHLLEVLYFSRNRVMAALWLMLRITSHTHRRKRSSSCNGTQASHATLAASTTDGSNK